MSKEISKRAEQELERAEAQRWITPLVDVYENNQEWLLVADLPGVEQNELRLHLDKSELTIEAARKPTVAAAMLAQELVGGSYHRVFELPAGVDSEKVSAELQNGVVTVHLPKTEALKPRRIAVRAG